MAKAKKDTTSTTPDAGAKPKQAAAPKAAATAAGPKSSAKKQPAPGKAAKPTTPASAPLIDTDLAASAAAAMVANRATLSQGGGAAKQESAGFRQLKESLAKPGAANLGGILGTGPMQQKKPQSHGPDRQIGRNQTFGADVNRASVPRRTGGG